MKMSFWGISGKLLASCLILNSLGCGTSSPQTSGPTQSQALENTTQAAEVTQSFSGFDSAVDQQAAAKQNSIPETPPSESQPSSTKPSTTQSQSAIPLATTPKASAPQKNAVPVPTAEQLKRWAVPPFDRLQLLACRDSGQAGFVTSATVVGDGEMYALAGSRLTAWSVGKDELLHDFSDTANTQVIKSFGASPDRKWLASGDDKGNLQIWDLPDFKQRVSKKIYPSGVAHLSISPDSASIATASFTGELTIWDVASLSPKNKFTVANQALQNILFVAPDRIAIAAQDSSIWNTETGKQEHSLTTGGYHSTFALSSDGKRLAFSNEGKIEFWNIQDGKVDGEIKGSFSGSDLAAFSPDGKYLVSASKFLIQISDIATGQLTQVIDTFGWQTTAINWLPKSSLLMITSENGRVRFWGNAAAASALDVKPLHSSLPLPSKDSGEPATPAQLLQAVDVRAFPKLPGAVAIGTSDMVINYSTSASVDEATVFYHHFLTQNSWSKSAEPASPPNAMGFTKQGFELGIYFSQNADGATQVFLTNLGNFDLRNLPKFDAQKVEVDFEGYNAVLYRVQASLLDIETTLIRRFFDAGWTSYARLNTSKLEDPQKRGLEFVKGGAVIHVAIERKPVDPSSYSVIYSRSLTYNSLPIPKDSGFVEFDGSTKPLLVASTAMNLIQTRDFYDEAMAAEGWLRRDSRKQFDEKSGWMDFIRGQCDVSIVLVALDSGRTQIRVGEGLENSSWQLKKVKEPDPKVTSNGIEAADIPALNSWSIVKYDAEQKQIDFVAKGTTTFAFAEAYQKELESRGFKTDGRGVKSDDYLLAEFKKEKAEITLRATLRDGEIQASLSGDGLLWTKALPVAQQIIAYETWLRINRHPASLDLLDKYIAEMKAIAKD